MKNTLLLVICGLTPFCFERLSQAQTKPENAAPMQEKNTAKAIALHPKDSEAFEWDGGKVKFLASSEETGGRWTVMECTERPGYKTPVHRHNRTDEDVDSELLGPWDVQK